MKKIKYLSFILFALILSVGIAQAEESAEMICKYEIDCSKIVEAKSGTTLSNTKKSVIEAFLTANGEYFFKSDGTNFIYKESNTGEEIQYPTFCGVSDPSGTMNVTVLNMLYMENYFKEEKIKSSTCPDMKMLYIDNKLYAIGDLSHVAEQTNRKVEDLKEYEIGLSFKPSKIESNEEIEASGGFRCYYECNDFLTASEKFLYMIQYSNKNFTVSGASSNKFKSGNNFADFSLYLKSAENCPTTIYINGYADSASENNLYFSRKKDNTGAMCKKINENAYLTGKVESSDYLEGQIDGEDSNYDMNLSGCIIDAGTQEIIDWIMNIIRVGGILLLIVLGMLDFIKAAASGEQEEMKKSKSKFIKRLIACVVLFLIPIVVDILLGLVNITVGEDCNETTTSETTKTETNQS